MTKFSELPISGHDAIAMYYWQDAIDFLARFDILWEKSSRKSSKIKAFVDLLMGCECVLKSHVILGSQSESLQQAFVAIKRSGHQISDLASAACFSEDRKRYEYLGSELGAFSVVVRYSVEAYGTFFPMDWSEVGISYSRTIGSDCWVMSVRSVLGELIAELKPSLTGLVSDDIYEIFNAERELKSAISKPRKEKK